MRICRNWLKQKLGYELGGFRSSILFEIVIDFFKSMCIVAAGASYV